MKRFALLIFLFAFVFGIAVAQSGRGSSDLPSDPEIEELEKKTAGELYTLATNYLRDKLTELELKKVPYSTETHRKILSEQKALAAKYASILAAKKDLLSVDQYYLGRLHWIAGNKDGALAAFEVFLASGVNDEDKKQSARAVAIDVLASSGETAKAEIYLKDYRAASPVKQSDLASMHKEMALAYKKAGDLKAAATHADAAYEASKVLLFESGSRARALNMLMDSGSTSFQIHRLLGDSDTAVEKLVTMRKYGAQMKSYSVYLFALDTNITYYLETNRRDKALALAAEAKKLIVDEIEDTAVRFSVSSRFKRREPHYKLIGLPAPELVRLDAFLPNKSISLADLKGKVVLIDFWATWCGPCLDAFPKLNDLYAEYGDQGFTILGLTRYYEELGKAPRSEKELVSIREFVGEHELKYPIIVANSQANQIAYSAMSLPTVVLVDKKGIIRNIYVGSSDGREREIESAIRLLLEE